MSYLGNTKIGKMYLGTVEIAKAYLGNNLVFQQGSQPQPVMIPYIRGGADGSYIDTGITPDNTTRVIVWGRNFNQGGQTNVWLFGSRVAYKNSMFDLVLGNANYTGAIAPAFGNEALSWVNDAWRFCSHYHKYEMSSSGLYIDDVQIATVTASSFSSNLNLHLFGYNSNGTHIDNSLPIDIYACKIYKSGVLVRDYTAVNSPSVGLYDAVSDTLFTNAGSGSFTYGTFNKNAYVPIEYIESNTNQYFDSGIHGRHDLPYVMKFIPNATTNYPQVFGGRTSSNSKKYGLSLGKESVNGAVITYQYNTGNTSYDNGTTMNGQTLVVVKGSSASAVIYRNSASIYTLSPTDATFETDYNIFVGSLNNAGTSVNGYAGKIYYLSFGSSRNFVPAKVSGVAGMYDTYNDVFYPSATETPFVAGPTI